MKISTQRQISFIAVVIILVTIFVLLGKEQNTNISIAVAESEKTDVETAKAICETINNVGDRNCVVILKNTYKGVIKELKGKNTNFAILRSDIAHDIQNNLSNIDKNNRISRLRLVGSLDIQSLVLLTRQNARLESLLDLSKVNTNFGKTGSLSNRILTELFFVLKISNFENVSLHEVSSQPELICNSVIDVAAFIIDRDIAILVDALRGCKKQAMTLISLDDDIFEVFIKKYPYYEKTIIPQGKFGLASQVEGINTSSLLVTLNSTHSRKVKYIIKNIESSLNKYEKHSNLTIDSFLDNSFGIQRHNATKYYR